jgi:AraC-like DNA-binding protein
MLRKQFIIRLILLVALCQSAYAQTGINALQLKTYEYLQEAIDKNDTDTIASQPYLIAYLKKAKNEKNNEKIAEGYRNFIYLAPANLKLFYADSMITAALKTGDPEVLGSTYLTRGIVHYQQKRYSKSLDEFIKANDYLYKTDNDYLKYKAKFGIANIKFYLGFYDEAIVILKDCVAYFNKDDYNNSKGYFTSLHSLGLCYNKIGRFDLCTATNEKGIKECAIRKYPEEEVYFLHSEGINQFSKKNYAAAISQLNIVLPDLKKLGDFASETLAYFYIAKSYTKLGDAEKALPYLKKVDRAFTEKEYIRPDLRENFELLINYYQANNNVKLQLHYINRLIKADSVLNNRYKYLSSKIHKEFDTKSLLRAKTEIERKLVYNENLSTVLYVAVVVLFTLVMFLLYRYYKTQRNYREKFEALMQKQEVIDVENVMEQKVIPAENKKPDINPEVIAAVLKQLEKFEKQKKFTQRELTLVGLASAFNTNSNYLSKIINFYRGKNYITYLNDLRIDYIVGRIKGEKRYRNYTIKALAEEAGFNTSQHFSKAFYARTGIYPSYFINELTKEYEEDSLTLVL